MAVHLQYRLAQLIIEIRLAEERPSNEHESARCTEVRHATRCNVSSANLEETSASGKCGLNPFLKRSTPG
jgi:hypothetical protein